MLCILQALSAWILAMLQIGVHKDLHSKVVISSLPHVWKLLTPGPA